MHAIVSKRARANIAIEGMLKTLERLKTDYEAYDEDPTDEHLRLLERAAVDIDTVILDLTGGA